MDIPSANHHVSPDKVGYLGKLSSRTFPYIPQWRRRYCVLTKGKLYYYEKEESKGNDKNNGVLNLDYFDEIYEAPPKDCKKATNVFILTSQDRSFFDPGRHYFSADTLTDLHDWIRKIRQCLEQTRNNNRPSLTKNTNFANSARKDDDQRKTDKEANKDKEEQLSDSRTSTKERRKKKQENSERPNNSPSRTSSRYNADDGHDGQIEQDSYYSSKSEENKSLIKKKAPLIMEGLLGFSGKSCEVQEQTKADFDLPETTPRLENITKRRPRPRDRKPPTKRNTIMKASSLSALQAEEDSSNLMQKTETEGAPPMNRTHAWLNRSLDLLEEERANESRRSKVKRPTLAYNYSSDESEGDVSRSDSFTTSASGFAPQPPPRMSSFNTNSQPPIPGPKPLRPLVPLGSLPSLHENDHKSSYVEEWRGSHCSMGASPFMDHLDNYLMNESVQAATPMDSGSSAGGSEISTCKAAGEPAPKSPTPETQVERICNSKMSDGYSSQDIINTFEENETTSTPDINKFVITTHHLQKHIVDLDHDLQGLTTDLMEAKNDVSSLQDTMTTIKSDADRVGETVTILSQEAARASRQIVSAAQEAEKTRRLASSALEEAEKTKGEYKKLKKEYEEIVEELKTTLATLKAGANAQKQKLSLDSSSSSKQGYQSLERQKHHSKSSSNSSTLESQKGSVKDESHSKLTGYQSLFVRPSSIISGLTNRASLTKSVSFVDQNNKKKKDSENDSKKEKKEEVKCHETKEEKKKFSSLERKQKSSKTEPKQDTIKSSFVNVVPRMRSKQRQIFSEAQRAMSNETLEDIPMMDENLERNERPRSSIGFSKISPITSSELNFDLGKSSSSPSVTEPTTGFRPKIVSLAPKQNQPNNSYVISSSESTLTSNVYNNVGSSSQSGSISSLYRPSSACGQLKRQSSMSTVPEDHVVANIIPTPPIPAVTKTRVFAISRQSSTPNLPIQRQNSIPSIPLQRQYSLGTVPEENKLPRQDSISSILDDRGIVDRTLPISPAGSIQCLPEERPSRASIRNSIEMVTGPIIAGSSFQHPTNPQNQNNEQGEAPLATSSLKKDKDKKLTTVRVDVS